MLTRKSRQSREGGQIIVLFAAGLVVMVAMVGLILDGSDTFNQRRGQQNGADLAAVAGANAYMNVYYSTKSVSSATDAATAAAYAAATTNGYTSGGGVTVSASVNLLSAGAEVRVNITKPHPNTFSRVMGFASWDVSVTAAAQAFVVDTAIGAAPWIMHIDAFNPDGSPKYDADHPHAFGEANGDYPISGTDLAWTDFNGNDNVNTNEVSDIIDGTNVVTATFEYGQYLGQHNQGNHTALYGDVQNNLVDHILPVPIVGPATPPPDGTGECEEGPPGHPDGCFYGWAFFVIQSASGGNDKTITGYFLDDFKSQPLTVGECTPEMAAADACGVISEGNPFGAYVVRLSD
jgi:Flp pilus assembly protein TadG